MYINIKDETLCITFPYAKSVIDALRTIPGRVFNPKLKRWEVPVENGIECLRVLEPLGFNVHLDVKRRVEALKKEIEESEELKINPSVPYSGSLPLYDFQKIGAAFLKARSASLLADVPGLGKTIQTIAALEEISGIKLVVCPASLKFSWQNEINKWKSNEIIFVVDGSKEERIEIYKNAKSCGNGYLIINYELLLHDFDILVDF